MLQGGRQGAVLAEADVVQRAQVVGVLRRERRPLPREVYEAPIVRQPPPHLEGVGAAESLELRILPREIERDLERIHRQEQQLHFEPKGLDVAAIHGRRADDIAPGGLDAGQEIVVGREVGREVELQPIIPHAGLQADLPRLGGLRIRHPAVVAQRPGEEAGGESAVQHRGIPEVQLKAEAVGGLVVIRLRALQVQRGVVVELVLVGRVAGEGAIDRGRPESDELLAVRQVGVVAGAAHALLLLGVVADARHRPE